MRYCQRQHFWRQGGPGITTTTGGVSTALRGRASTRLKLLEAVDELQAERGWTACTLQAITRRAGLTTGAVYSTFGSRGALLAAAMVRRSEGFAGLPAGEHDLVEAVAAYARLYWVTTEHAAGVELFTMQLDLIRLAHDDEALAEALREGYDMLLHRLVKDLEALGREAAEPSPVEVARRLVGVLQGLTIQKLAFGAAPSEESFVEAALAVVGLRR